MKFFKKSEKSVSLNSCVVWLALTAVHSYNAVPRRGPGSTTSEGHLRNEFWAPVLSNCFKLDGLKFLSVWELEHLIPGNAGKGSSKCDFAAATLDAGGIPVPFFIVEFEVGGFATHKDTVVCSSEAVFELGQLIGKLNVTKAELGELQIFMGLVNDTKITIDVITAEYDLESDMIFYVRHPAVASFDLSNADTNILETLNLLVFIQTVVIPKGKDIQTLLNCRSGPSSISNLLPKLPPMASKSSQSKTMFTPLNKRAK
ncbi:hypothetical protein HK100_008652, partial [Physocladia obscura]